MPRRLGPYAPLSATYSSDDAIIAAGEKAELLYVRGLAFCASAPENDGYITEAQLVRFVGAGMRDASARAKTLVREGLWAEIDGGYVVRGWLKWNKSAEELGRSRKKDRERKAALNDETRERIYARDGYLCRYCGTAENLCIDHIRPLDLAGSHEDDNLHALCQPCNWRKGRRDATGLTAEQARETYGIDYGIPVPESRETHGNPVPGSQEELLDSSDVPVSRTGASGDHSTPHHNNPPTPPRGKPGSRRAAYDYDRHPDFQRFWEVYPEKSGKGAALKAWLNALGRGNDPESIIKAAEHFRDDPRRNPEKTKHPQGWLNDERFLDQATTRGRGSGGWLEN